MAEAVLFIGGPEDGTKGQIAEPSPVIRIIQMGEPIFTAEPDEIGEVEISYGYVQYERTEEKRGGFRIYRYIKPEGSKNG